MEGTGTAWECPGSMHQSQIPRSRDKEAVRRQQQLAGVRRVLTQELVCSVLLWEALVNSGDILSVRTLGMFSLDWAPLGWLWPRSALRYTSMVLLSHLQSSAL